MNDIFIDLNVAKNTSTRIIDNANNLSSDMEKLKEYIEYIKVSWDGNARDLFIDRLNDYVDELSRCSTLFRDDGEKINKSALSYEKLEQYFLNKDI